MKKSNLKENDNNQNEIMKEEFQYRKQWHSFHARSPQEGYNPYKEVKKPIDWENEIGETKPKKKKGNKKK